MGQIIDKEHLRMAGKLRRLMAVYKEIELLVRVGVIEDNYLNPTSTDLFNMVGINVETLNTCHFNMKEVCSDEANHLWEKIMMLIK